MAWVRIDDGFPEHPKVLAAGGDAAWLHVCALAYSNRNLTDGVIPKRVVTRLSDRKGVTRLVARLIEVGLWTEHPEGYVIHDYLDYQQSREQVEQTREKARSRMANARRAPNVRANIERSAPEQDAKFADCSRNPIPSHPIPNRDDDDCVLTRRLPDEPSSSSFFDQVPAAAARLLLSRAPTGTVRSPNAWLAATARTIARERAEQLRNAHARGLSVELAAEFVLTDPAEQADEARSLDAAVTFGRTAALADAAIGVEDADGFAAVLGDASSAWRDAACAAYAEVFQHPSTADMPSLRLVQGEPQ